MKKFWNILKRVLLLAGITGCLGAFVFVLTSAVEKQKTLVCKGIQAKVDFETGVNFISAQEVIAKINYLSGGSIVGKALMAVDFRTIEKELLKNPYIAHAEFFTDHSQIVHATIMQKQPLLRIINNDGVGYYLSDNSEKIPLSDNFTAHVPIARGTVETQEDLYGDSIVLSELFHLAQYAKLDTFLNAMLDHVEVDVRGDLEIYPKWGGHVVVFGRADETMPEKFERLKIFYREGMAKVGWDKYSVVNVKYSGQVVCERKSATAAIAPNELIASDSAQVEL